MKIRKYKLLVFCRPDSQTIELNVPDELNQEFIPRVKLSDYSVRLVRPNRLVSESEVATISIDGGKTIGYLIPGAALLSKENPNNSDRAYAAYSIIAAHIICTQSHNKKYDLVAYDHAAAKGPESVFATDGYYLITWDSQIANPHNFKEDYEVCLCSKGLVYDQAGTLPKALNILYDNTQKNINLRKTIALPTYVATILTGLIPYTDNPFLRFFYLYQIIEHLMSEDLDRSVNQLRANFTNPVPPSFVDIKDALKNFQLSTKEDSRINKALLPPCSSTQACAEQLLDSLAVDYSTMSFADKIYKIRNILFHDYQRLHSYAADLHVLAENLFVYLLDKKVFR